MLSPQFTCSQAKYAWVRERAHVRVRERESELKLRVKRQENRDSGKSASCEMKIVLICVQNVIHESQVSL